MSEVKLTEAQKRFCEVAERNARELSKFIRGDDDRDVVLDAATAIQILLAALETSHD